MSSSNRLLSATQLLGKQQYESQEQLTFPKTITPNSKKQQKQITFPNTGQTLFVHLTILTQANSILWRNIRGKNKNFLSAFGKMYS